MKKPRKPHQPHEGAGFYFAPPWPTRDTPKAPSTVPWCTTTALRYDGPTTGTGLYAAFRKVRCPVCGRRLQLMTVDIENGYGDFWPYIPPHKIRKLAARKINARIQAEKTKKRKKKSYGSRRGK